ncbi:hypothetical protein [Geoglobus acetivorans]|uniref:Uncharacterized protein n=1 Tax=Geoglobus acetivorans TaxID=565033 RepID=A0ABZ3H4E4_GEOAI|nr:hypothetical protein [Geoglobus acetivorans]
MKEIEEIGGILAEFELIDGRVCIKKEFFHELLKVLGKIAAQIDMGFHDDARETVSLLGEVIYSGTKSLLDET